MKTLLERRKSEAKPHMSFDITGDGMISAKELLLANRFDEDKDGKLNQEEKSKLLEALAQGYEQKIVIGPNARGDLKLKDPAVQ